MPRLSCNVSALILIVTLNWMLTAIGSGSFMMPLAFAAQKPDGESTPAKRSAMAVREACSALQRGDGDAAKAALDGTDGDEPGFVFALLRQLADQPNPQMSLVGTAVPVPDARYAVAVLNPVKPIVAYVCDKGVVATYDLDKPNQEPKQVVSSRQKPLMHGAFSGDGAFFVAGDSEGGVTLWDARSWKETASLVKGDRPVRSVAINGDGSRILAETQAGVVLWDSTSGQEIGVVSPTYNFGTAMAFSGDRRHCATGGLFSIVIVDANTGESIREIKHAPYTMHLCFSPDGQRIASGLRGSLNKWLGVFDVATGDKVFDGARHDKGITGVLFLDGGGSLLSTSADGAVKVWHVPSGTELLSLKMAGSVYQPSVSADGKIVLWNQRGGPRYFRLN